MRTTTTITTAPSTIRVTLRENGRIVQWVDCKSGREADALKARWLRGGPAQWFNR